ncbi:hypothetical protein BOTBODRAFT_56202 [Botryobasidium botryosum FD-172 SS1]|uniref:Uncharacterized protein n=1 Tax=Botryobasidium botryosum (strain FD-172 SS1) TaxID=930990 RepID=A0A067MNG1_BOTB1|nr:hypothetical protein BOTBODRAFT_56202 [Botryobasidium botryosum FD-172 SS1]
MRLPRKGVGGVRGLSSYVQALGPPRGTPLLIKNPTPTTLQPSPAVVDAAPPPPCPMSDHLPPSSPPSSSPPDPPRRRRRADSFSLPNPPPTPSSSISTPQPSSPALSQSAAQADPAPGPPVEALQSLQPPPEAESTGEDGWIQIDAEEAAADMPGLQDMYFDDEGLSTLEKIYLFSRSHAVFHRVFISRALPSYLPEVTPSDAVEYVLPLLNALGTDPEDAVKEAFVAELVPIIWWFLNVEWPSSLFPPSTSSKPFLTVLIRTVR